MASVALLIVLSTGARAATGDSRIVNEPAFPTTTCATLQANLQATNGVFSGYDETAAGNSQPDTTRIQAAISGCASTTQVRAVELQANVANNAFLIGPITLANGVILVVDPGVTLYGSRYPLDYGSSLCGTNTNGTGNCTNLITANSVHNGGIMGYGVIDGRGQMTMIGSTKTWYSLGQTGNIQSTPRMLKLSGSCTNFTLYKITMQNSGYFTVSASGSGNNGVTLWDVKITTPWTDPNTDGFDPTGTNVTLTNSFISDGDDNVAIKASTSASAATNMTFSHNHFYAGHGMSIGSETNLGDSNILVTDLAMAGNSLDGNQNGLRIKSYPGKGGTVTDVVYDGVCIKDTNDPIVIDPNYSTGSGSLPIFQNITIRNTHILYDSNMHYNGGKNIQLDGYSAADLLGLTLDNVILDSPPSCGSFYHSQYANITLGPGPVNFAACITGTACRPRLPPFTIQTHRMTVRTSLFIWPASSSGQATVHHLQQSRRATACPSASSCNPPFQEILCRKAR